MLNQVFKHVASMPHPIISFSILISVMPKKIVFTDEFRRNYKTLAEIIESNPKFIKIIEEGIK